MTIHIPFPSIEQYRTTIKHVSDRCKYHNEPLPTLKFHGTVKLHGTNASVYLTPSGELHAQSRSNIITPDSDNAGFAAFVHKPLQHDLLVMLAELVRSLFDSQPVNVAVYGEWCGASIQKGVAISKLPKMFVIFGIKVVGFDNEQSTWLSPSSLEKAYDTVGLDRLQAASIFCIEKFQTFDITIDMAEPAMSQNTLVEITNAVEACCPVGKAFGVEGVGEGVVWECIGAETLTSIKLSDLTFKVKGAKHSESNVKVIAPVDIERLNSVKALVESVVTEHRLEKAIAFLQETLHDDDVIHMKNIGPFLRWVGMDVVKEELDTIEGNDFSTHEVTKAVNEKAKAWFLAKLLL